MLTALLLLTVATVADAEEVFLRERQNAHKVYEREFLDWIYAQKVWDTLQTRAAFEAERAKYVKEFDPWFDRFKADPKQARSELYGLKPDSAIRRGYDLQLLLEQFQINHKMWWDYFSVDAQRKPIKTFTEAMAREPCKVRRSKTITNCGTHPDWRTDAERAADEKLWQDSQTKKK